MSTGLSATTLSDGTFSIDCVPVGSRTLETSAAGFTTRTDTIPIVNGETTAVSIALVPITSCTSGERGPITVVLTWGQTPRDLDSHLSGPDVVHGGRFHVAYYNLNPVEYASLDVDDTTSFGPETVTLTVSSLADETFVPGEYRYWVHDFTDRLGTSQFMVSNAVVTVTQCNTQLAQYSVANATGNSSLTLWRVFNFTLTADGTVTLAPVQAFEAGDYNTVL
jgi:hypothetical protein